MEVRPECGCCKAPVGLREPVSIKYTRDAVCQEAVLSFLMRLPEALNEDRSAAIHAITF